MQGPEARARLARVSAEAAAVHRFAVERFEWGGATCLVAGTGYTGEDGVECAVPAEVAPDFWEAVLGAGCRSRPGLGARDTLRLEAGLPLHGHELGPGHHPAPGRAGLGDRVGQGRRSPGGPPSRRRRRTARPGGCAASSPTGASRLRDGSLLCEGVEQVGILTSGNFSPMRERGIGLGFVDADARLLDGDAITIVQRGRELPAHLVRPPLWPIREEEESE